MNLFDPGPTVTPEMLSRDQRRTLRQRALILGGVHPITGARLAGNGETCGTCAHLERYRYRTRNYIKCGMNETRSAATDCRVGWPACTMWAARPGSAA